jgi:hypothetical protein
MAILTTALTALEQRRYIEMVMICAEKTRNIRRRKRTKADTGKRGAGIRARLTLFITNLPCSRGCQASVPTLRKLPPSMTFSMPIFRLDFLHSRTEWTYFS